jgi:aminopeptidase N
MNSMTDFHNYLESLIRGDWFSSDYLFLASREDFCFPGDKQQWQPEKPYDIEHLLMDWQVSLEKQTIKAKNSLTIKSKVDNLNSIRLHAYNQQISSITIKKGEQLQFDHNPDEESLVIHFNKPLSKDEEKVLIFRYQIIKPQAGGFFIKANEYFPDYELQFWTQFQDDYARYLVPIYDHPSHKFPTETLLTVPKGFYAISNGALKEQKKNDDGTVTYHWIQEKPIPAYLMTMAVGKFKVYTEKHGDLEVIYYAEPKWDKETVYRSFGKTPEMIKFFEDKLKVPFPWAKYGQIAATNFVMGGMENVSVTTQTDATFHDKKAHKDYKSEGLVSHELAHQWGGDLITCKSWSHGWINEGWATQMQNEWKKHDLGESEYLYEQLGKQEAYFSEDKEKYRRPIVQTKWKYGFDVFDRHLYPGAAWRYYMLKHLVGEEVWWDVLNHFLTSNAYQSVETIDLQRAFEEKTGKSYDWFFDQWIYKAGYPEVKINCSYQPKKKQLKVKLEQKQEHDLTVEAFRFPLTIECFYENEKNQRYTLDVEEKIHTYYFSLPEKPERIEIDPDYAVLMDGTIDKEEQLWINQLTEGSNIIMRIKAAKAIGKKASYKGIKALNEALQKESFWAVQLEIAKVLGQVKTEQALEGLVDALDLKDSRARTAVARALGNFHESVKALKGLKKLTKDKDSYFVVGAAATSIGKTKHGEAFDFLKTKLPTAGDSWQEIIRRGYIAGLAATEKEEAIDLILPFLEVGKSDYLRREAIKHLGKLGKRYKNKKAEIKDLLEKTLLTDKSYRVIASCLSAIKNYEDASLIPTLRRFIEITEMHGFRRNTKSIIRSLSKKKEDTEIKSMQKSIEELEKENRELKERIEKVEFLLNEKE